MDGTGGVNTRKRDVVTAPVQLDVLLLQGEEDDQSADGDAAGEGRGGDAKSFFLSVPRFTIRQMRRCSLVILGPPAQETPPEIVIEEVCDRDGGPNVGHVVGSPNESTDQENRNMEVGENPEPLAKVVKRDGQNSANGEAPQESIVDGARAEHFPWTESAPEDGGGEERVVPRAGKVILLAGQTDVGNLCHLVIEDRRADEGGDESRPHLAVECDPWSDVNIVGELEILSKVKCLRGRDVTVGLEIIHSSGVTGEPETAE